jgi:hypothetical protein
MIADFKMTNMPVTLKINWFAKNALTNVLILSKDIAKLVYKVLIYQDIYRPEHLSSKYVKPFIVFIMKT